MAHLNKYDFRHASPDERVNFLLDSGKVTLDEAQELKNAFSLPRELGNRLVENYISNVEIPMGIATNFLINGKEYLIPMATEEPSVIAACSNGAKVARELGGFKAFASESIMIGQVQLVEFNNRTSAETAIISNRKKIVEMANEKSTTLKAMGKGAQDLRINTEVTVDDMIIIHLIVDVGDAMGANLINAMCEHISPFIEELTGGKTVLRILSNLSPDRITTAQAEFPASFIGGEEGVKRFLYAARQAVIDPYRATTHNKGIMNGIDSVLLATMNDWRQAEANAHAYACRNGRYTALTTYTKLPNGNVLGSIEIPLSAGTVGGSSRSVSKAKINMKILGISGAREFEEVLACVGLAQNFAAMRALSNEGIQKGHMTLHSKNLAISVGAKGEEIEKVSNMLVRSGRISMTEAAVLLEELRRRK